MPVILAMLASAAGSIGLKVLSSLVTPKVLEWAMFKSADLLVKHTATDFDDEGLAKLKEAYYGEQKESPKQP